MAKQNLLKHIFKTWYALYILLFTVYEYEKLIENNCLLNMILICWINLQNLLLFVGNLLVQLQCIGKSKLRCQEIHTACDFRKSKSFPIKSLVFIFYKT